MKHVDTICALASGPPPAALIVLRVSGPAVAEFMAQHLQPSPTNPRRAVLSRLTLFSLDVCSSDSFVYRDGPLDAGSGLTTKRWTMGPRHITQSYVPSSLRIFKSTGQQGRTSERTNFNFGYYYLFKPVEDYFVIPYKCLQQQQH